MTIPLASKECILILQDFYFYFKTLPDTVLVCRDCGHVRGFSHQC